MEIVPVLSGVFAFLLAAPVPLDGDALIQGISLFSPKSEGFLISTLLYTVLLTMGMDGGHR